MRKKENRGRTDATSARWLLAVALVLVIGGFRTHMPRSGPAAFPAGAALAADRHTGGFPLTVTDDTGRRITFSRTPRRLVSLAPSHTETLYALGLGDRLVAADVYSQDPPQARAKATLRTWPRPPIERLISLRPDLVLVFIESDESVRQMQGARLKVVKLSPRTVENALADILLIGRVTGSEPAAERLVASMRNRIRAVQQRVEGAQRPRVYYEIDRTAPQRPFALGSGISSGELLELAGGRNIFADLQRAAGQVSIEQVLARDPEVILVGGADHAREILRRPGWSGITAVRTGRVFAVDGRRVTLPGPRLADALEELARCVHPERWR